MPADVTTLHNIIIKHGQNLLNKEGETFVYLNEKNNDGVCHALAAMIAQAIFCGEIDKFSSRLEWLRKHSSQEVNDWVKKASELSPLERKLLFAQHEKKEKLSIYESNLLIASEIPAFYEGINLHQNSYEFKHLLTPKKDKKSDFYYDEVLNLILPGKLRQNPPVSLNQNFSGVYTKADLITYLSSFAQITENHHLSGPICFSLDSVNHRTLLSYNPISKSWLFFDANQGIISGSPSKIADHILKGFFSNKFSIFSTRISCLESDQVALNTICNDWKSSQAFEKIHGFKDEPNEKINKKDPYEGTWLLCSARNHDLHSENYLLTQEVDVNATSSLCGSTALHYAVEDNNLELAKSLLEKKADLNIKNSYADSPFSMAIKDEKLELVTLLLNHGAKVNEPFNNNENPVFFSIKKDCIGLLKILIAHDANINLADEFGETPLIFAVKNDNIELLELLLQNGANPDLCNDEKINPFMQSCFCEHKDIKKILMRYKLTNKGENFSQIITDEQLFNQFWIEMEKTGYAKKHGLTFEFLSFYKDQPIIAESTVSSTENTRLSEEWFYELAFKAIPEHNVAMLDKILTSASIEQRFDLLQRGVGYNYPQETIKSIVGNNQVELFFETIEKNDISVLKFLLDQHKKSNLIDSKNHEGLTPLMSAILKNNKESIEFIYHHSIQDKKYSPIITEELEIEVLHIISSVISSPDFDVKTSSEGIKLFLDEIQKSSLLSNHDEHYLYGKTDNYAHLIYTALNTGNKAAADFLISKIKDSDPLSFLFFNLISSNEDVYSKIIEQMKLNVNVQPSAISMFSLFKTQTPSLSHEEKACFTRITGLLSDARIKGSISSEPCSAFVADLNQRPALLKQMVQTFSSETQIDLPVSSVNKIHRLPPYSALPAKNPVYCPF